MNRAVFFDRDGVLNKLVSRDNGLFSPRDISSFELFKSVASAVKSIKAKGYLCIVVSNQPDVARGMIKKSVLDKMTTTLYQNFELDDVFYCIHDDPDKTGCRKPAPGMIYKAKKKWNIDLGKSIMIGDSEKDLGTAINAGVRFFLLDRDYNQSLNVNNRINKVVDILQYLN